MSEQVATIIPFDRKRRHHERSSDLPTALEHLDHIADALMDTEMSFLADLVPDLRVLEERAERTGDARLAEFRRYRRIGEGVLMLRRIISSGA